jgi:RNase P/RNase MRP subunit p30
VDLHILPRVDDEASSRKMSRLARLAGYSAVALTVPTGLLRDRVSAMRRLFESEGLQTLLRVDLSANSRADLLRLLRRYRNAYDVVAVKCTNSVVATVACRDRRVDIVFFDAKDSRARFGHPQARLLRGAVEFNLMSTLLGESRSEVFNSLARQAAVALEHRSNVVLSSGSDSPNMIRSPIQLSAIAAEIGLSREQSRQGTSEAPLSIIQRNLERRSREYVEDGVKLVTAKEA